MRARIPHRFFFEHGLARDATGIWCPPSWLFSSGSGINIKRLMASFFDKYVYHTNREEARARIEALGEPFKLEILDSIKTEPITLYHVGDEWWDLCAGPHVETTGETGKEKK